MKDKMERFVLLPFSIGCVSESSVAVGVDQPKSSGRKPDNYIITNKLPPITTKRKEEDEESSSSTADSIKSISSMKFLAIPKPSISKLLKSFKSFTQLFVYKEEMDEDLEMEIGHPTDVKHVTHIGLDGSANTNPIQGWDHLFGPHHRNHQLISDLSNSPDDDPLKQFELSMAAQAAGPATTLVHRHHQLKNKVY